MRGVKAVRSLDEWKQEVEGDIQRLVQQALSLQTALQEMNQRVVRASGALEMVLALIEERDKEKADAEGISDNGERGREPAVSPGGEGGADGHPLTGECSGDSH